MPPAFDGYTILHLTDFHLDGIEGTTGRVLDLIEGPHADICTTASNDGFRVHGSVNSVLPDFHKLVGAIQTRDEIYATLGTHDTVAMVVPLEQPSIQVLANQTIEIGRGGETVLLNGLDDVHYYFTQDALYDHGGAGQFRLVAVLPPEFATQAATASARLYLTGHTHGGQICLPGGRLIITHIVGGRKYTADTPALRPDDQLY